MLCSAALATLILASACSVNADGLYTKNSPVLQVNAKNYNSLIAKSNHTSIVEFYAPWCGHCQNLKPAYEKAAKNLVGLAKVAAVNCDEDSNKSFCGQLGVKGFPTLKIVKPGSKPGRPVVEDYQGPRSAKAIVDAVVDQIPNHVKRVQDSGLDAWLSDKSAAAKAILFTDKGTTSAMIKALAIDFLGNIHFAQIRNKETAAVERFQVQKFPTVVLIPGEGQDPVVHDGELSKEALVKFFSQVAPPNPDPAPKKAKPSPLKGAKSAAASSASSKFAEASKAHKARESPIDVDDDNKPTDSPVPIVEKDQEPSVVAKAAPAIPHLQSAQELEAACLTKSSGNCILILLPQLEDEGKPPQNAATEALSSFAEIAEKHKKRGANIFPFYGVPASNPAGTVIRKVLDLKSETDIEIIAINKKRKWWRAYSASAYDIASADNFVDAIKLGEGSKHKLPSEFYPETDMPQPETPSGSEPIGAEDDNDRVRDEL